MRNIFFPHYLSGEPIFVAISASVSLLGKKTFCRQTHRTPVHYRDSSLRHTDSHASLRMAFSIPHPALLYKQTDAFFRHSAFHCRPVICLISTFPLYIRKAGDGKLYIKTDVMPNDNDD